MKTRLDFMRRTFFKTLAFGIAILSLASASYADWVAYNDQLAGSGTSPNATTNDIRNQTSGFLKNVANAANLPVTLSVTRAGTGISYTLSGNIPPSGSPLYNAFNGFVTFAGGGSGDANVEITTNGTVTYTFTGLNPSKLYSLKAGAVGGLPIA